MSMLCVTARSCPAQPVLMADNGNLNPGSSPQLCCTQLAKVILAQVFALYEAPLADTLVVPFETWCRNFP